MHQLAPNARGDGKSRRGVRICTRASHEGDATHASLPPRGFLASKGEVARTIWHPATIVGGEDGDRAVPNCGILVGLFNCAHRFVEHGHHGCIHAPFLPHLRWIAFDLRLRCLQRLMHRLECHVHERGLQLVVAFVAHPR